MIWVTLIQHCPRRCPWCWCFPRECAGIFNTFPTFSNYKSRQQSTRLISVLSHSLQSLICHLQYVFHLCSVPCTRVSTRSVCPYWALRRSKSQSRRQICEIQMDTNGSRFVFCVTSMHTHRSEAIIADVWGSAVTQKTHVARGRWKENNKQKLACACLCVSLARSFPAIKGILVSTYLKILHMHHVYLYYGAI